jgi:AcrR family transcriptional regulator
MPIEVRRRQVLDAALGLITEHGYGAATMEAIAREADLAKPVVYNAYPGLGPLLHALLEREEQSALKTLAEAMPAQPVAADASGLLLFWLRSLADAIAQNPGRWRLMLIPPEETPDVVREHVQAGRTFALTQVRLLVGALLDERRSLSRVDPDLAAQAVFAIAEHAAKLLIRDPVQYTAERLVEFAKSIMELLQLE